MARQDLGGCDCPVCGKSGAHVREAEGKGGKPGKAYIVCEECNTQIFARGPESDKLIRAAMRGVRQGSAEVVHVSPLPVKVDDVVIPPEKPVEKEDQTVFDLLNLWPKKQVVA